MAIELFCDFDYRQVERAFTAVQTRTVEQAKKVATEGARGFVRRVVSVTPPASAGRTGLAARRQGECAIDRDLKGIFVPTILKGKRPEQWPNVEAIYNQYMANRKGRGGPRLGKKYHVDTRKLEALRAKLYGRVGVLAGGWNAAARALDVDLPAWIRRHGEEHGGFSVQGDDSGLLITINNSIEYSGDVRGYPRRVQASLDYVAAGMLRELDYLLRMGLDER